MQHALDGHALHALFHPASVAVIGASTQPQKVGYRICKQLLGEKFPGTLVPVNLRGEPVAGCPSVKRLGDYAGAIDVAVITTATEQVVDAVRDCAEQKVKFAIIHTAGFAEIGAAGRAIEQELVRICRAGGTRIVGPNCMQIFNASHGLNLIGTPFPYGKIAMISQSGNLIRAMTEEFETLGIGFSKFVSIGNQADLATDEYLDYLKDDPETQAIVVYVEGFQPGSGRRFIEAAAQAVRKKPVLLFKGGRTSAGSRSAISHTGSLAGQNRVVEAAMRQAGVLLVDRFDELAPLAHALSGLPLPKGRRMAVVGGGGGHATVCADALEACGLEVPEFSAEARQEMRRHLPERAATVNPVDFTGASEREIAVYAKVPEIALADNMDGALLYGLYAGYRTDLQRPGNTYVETSKMIVDLVRRSGKPIVMQTVYARWKDQSLAILRAGGVPVIDSVEHSARCLAALYEYGQYRNRAADAPTPSLDARLPGELLARAGGRAQRNLSEAESLEALAGTGIGTVSFRRATSADEAVAAAEALGYPVVVKAHSPGLVHKSDAGGVALNLDSADVVRDAFGRVTRASGCSEVVVAEFVGGGVELIVGAFRDPCFGPVLMFGLGGIHVEVLEDVTFRVLPVGPAEAASMLDDLAGRKLLGAYRGRPARDRDAIAEILVRVGDIMLSNSEIAELDLNPVVSLPQGALVADARIICSAEAEAEVEELRHA